MSKTRRPTAAHTATPHALQSTAAPGARLPLAMPIPLLVSRHTISQLVYRCLPLNPVSQCSKPYTYIDENAQEAVVRRNKGHV